MVASLNLGPSGQMECCWGGETWGDLRCDIPVPEGFLTLPPCSGRHFKKECLCVAGILFPLQGGAGKAPSSGTSLGKGFG